MGHFLNSYVDDQRLLQIGATGSTPQPLGSKVQPFTHWVGQLSSRGGWWSRVLPSKDGTGGAKTWKMATLRPRSTWLLRLLEVSSVLSTTLWTKKRGQDTEDPLASRVPRQKNSEIPKDAFPELPKYGVSCSSCSWRPWPLLPTWTTWTTWTTGTTWTTWTTTCRWQSW